MSKVKLALTVLIICCLYILQGCNKDSSNDSPSDTTTEGGEVYASVNDVVISKQEFDQFAQAKRASQPESNFSDRAIIDEMIATEILRQEAIKQGINDRAAVKEQIKRQENNILINALLTEKFAKLSFTDDELKAEYDRINSMSDSSEYKARHILLQTEDDAVAVIDELNGGADFIELAKQKSQGPSAPNGGDLGWFKADTMVPEFAQAVQTMKKGAYSTSPVQTQFGWHVILLEDTRKVEQAAFEDVKQEIQRALTRKSIEQYVDELQKNATIVLPEELETKEG